MWQILQTVWGNFVGSFDFTAPQEWEDVGWILLLAFAIHFALRHHLNLILFNVDKLVAGSESVLRSVRNGLFAYAFCQILTEHAEAQAVLAAALLTLATLAWDKNRVGWAIFFGLVKVYILLSTLLA